MTKKIVDLPRVAEPTVEQVLGEFLADQQKRLKSKTFKQYEDVIWLFKNSINSYAYQSLTKAEEALFDKYFNAEGSEHREFYQIFGPDKILGSVGEFLGYYMIRKVIAGEDLVRAAGTVTKRLSQWLAEKGYVSGEEAKEAAQEGGRASRDLPKAKRAARIISLSTQRLLVHPSRFDDEDYIEFDHFVVSRIEPGKLWLEESYGTERFGPISVAVPATDILREGWEISCALGRIRGKWWIVEMGNIYPS